MNRGHHVAACGPAMLAFSFVVDAVYDEWLPVHVDSIPALFADRASSRVEGHGAKQDRDMSSLVAECLEKCGVK